MRLYNNMFSVQCTNTVGEVPSVFKPSMFSKSLVDCGGCKYPFSEKTFQVAPVVSFITLPVEVWLIL